MTEDSVTVKYRRSGGSEAWEFTVRCLNQKDADEAFQVITKTLADMRKAKGLTDILGRNIREFKI